jgi:hypothetical protein
LQWQERGCGRGQGSLWARWAKFSPFPWSQGLGELIAPSLPVLGILLCQMPGPAELAVPVGRVLVPPFPVSPGGPARGGWEGLTWENTAPQSRSPLGPGVACRPSPLPAGACSSSLAMGPQPAAPPSPARLHLTQPPRIHRSHRSGPGTQGGEKDDIEVGAEGPQRCPHPCPGTCDEVASKKDFAEAWGLFTLFWRFWDSNSGPSP